MLLRIFVVKVFFLNCLSFINFHRSSVIRQKGESQNGCFKKNKARQIFRKTNISYPQIRTRTCAYPGVRNVRFSENLACFDFFKHPFWDSHFCLITDELPFSLFASRQFSISIANTNYNVLALKYVTSLFHYNSSVKLTTISFLSTLYIVRRFVNIHNFKRWKE